MKNVTKSRKKVLQNTAKKEKEAKKQKEWRESSFHCVLASFLFFLLSCPNIVVGDDDVLPDMR